MRRRILTLSKLLIYVATHLFALVPLRGQSTEVKPEVRHYGYSVTDKLLQCIQKVYGKPVASNIDIRGWTHAELRCPSTREGIDDLLQTKVSPLLKVQPYGILLFETPEWVYLIPAARFSDDHPGRYRWKRIKIETKVEVDTNSDDSMDEADAKELVPEILKFARMIPLQPQDTGKEDEAGVGIRLRFYEAKLGPNSADSIVTIIDQPSLLLAGRLVYGERRSGEYTVLWDSPLINSHGNIRFADVNGDGWKEIIWDASTWGGAHGSGLEQLAVFNQEGREITRQRDCVHGDFEWFDETDGVCAIEGNDIEFTVISAFPLADLPERLPGPKDIVVPRWYADGKDGIFILVDGAYTLSKLSAAALSKTRKAKSEREAAILNDRGMSLMKEGNYADAAKSFREASQTVNMENPLYDNNLGYAYYKSGEYKYAIGALGSAISMDPKRAIAYLNRGDAFLALYRTAAQHQDDKDYFKSFCVESPKWCVAEAREDYEKYLELAPDSKSAPDVKKKLEALAPTP
jgi:TPR repeat